MKTILRKLFLILVFSISLGIILPITMMEPTYAVPDAGESDVCSSTDPELEAVKEAAGCNGNENLLGNIIINLLYTVIFVAGVVSVVYIVIGGVKYMSSKGDAGALQTAKKTILYALIGLVITSLAFLIVNFTINLIYSDGSSSGGSSEPESMYSDEKIRQIKIIDKKIILGETQKIKAHITPLYLSNSSALIWKSSDPSVVSVDSQGNITASKEGTATITVTTENGKTDSAEITVTKPIEADRVVLSPSALDVAKGKSYTITATVFPRNASNKSITWSSKDKTIATVNKSGRVTAKKAGTTTITAKTANGKTATATVKVTDSDNGSGVIQINQSLINGLKKYYQDDYAGSQYSVSCYKGGSAGVGQEGCGISAYLAVHYALTQQHVNYRSFGQAVCNAGLSIPVAVDAVANKFKSKYKIQLNEISTSWDAIDKSLKNNHPVIILTRDQKYARASLHYITALSYDEKKGVYIWNPNKKNNGWHSGTGLPSSVVRAWSARKVK